MAIESKFEAVGVGVIMLAVLAVMLLVCSGLVYGISHGLTYLFPVIPAFTFKKSIVAALVIAGIRSYFVSRK
jgi:hypothetical protein